MVLQKCTYLFTSLSTSYASSEQDTRVRKSKKNQEKAVSLGLGAGAKLRYARSHLQAPLVSMQGEEGERRWRIDCVLSPFYTPRKIGAQIVTCAGITSGVYELCTFAIQLG